MHKLKVLDATPTDLCVKYQNGSPTPSAYT